MMGIWDDETKLRLIPVLLVVILFQPVIDSVSPRLLLLMEASLGKRLSAFSVEAILMFFLGL
jgi:hypothetical protein